MRRLTEPPRHAFRFLRYRLPQPWSNVLATMAYLAHLRSATVRKHLAEERLIERLARSAEPLENVGRGLSERVIEVPWVFRRIGSGHPVVLDVGAAFASLAYKRLLVRIRGRRLDVVDLSPFDPRDAAAFRRAGIHTHVADVRNLPFAAECFDVACCVSTLEHVGMDNELYVTSSERDEGGDVAALRELARVTTPEGRILVTVPAGERRDFDWHRQYDVVRFTEIVERAGLCIETLDLFVHDSSGWRRGRQEELKGRSYSAGDLSAAAVLCAALRKM